MRVVAGSFGMLFCGVWRWLRLVCGSGRVHANLAAIRRRVGRVLYPTHYGGYDHYGIDIGDKAHEYGGIFGYPGIGGNVAVADGQYGDVAEVKEIVNGVFAIAQAVERAGVGKFNGKKKVKPAVADEQKAANRCIDNAGCDHMRLVYLPENLKHDAAEKADIEQQHFRQKIADKKNIQRPANKQQHAKKHHKPYDTPLELKNYQSRQQLKRQVNRLGHAAIDIVGEEDIADKNAEQRSHQQLKAVDIECGA